MPHRHLYFQFIIAYVVKTERDKTTVTLANFAVFFFYYGINHTAIPILLAMTEH